MSPKIILNEMCAIWSFMSSVCRHGIHNVVRAMSLKLEQHVSIRKSIFESKSARVVEQLTKIGVLCSTTNPHRYRVGRDIENVSGQTLPVDVQSVPLLRAAGCWGYAAKRKSCL